MKIPRFLGGLLILGVAMFVLGRMQRPASEATTTPADELTPSEAVVHLKVVKLDWRRGGFGTVAVVDRLTIENDNAAQVRDVELSCVTYAPSGTALDSLTPTLYRVFPAKKKTTVSELNLGLINQQAQSLWCSVVYAQPG